MVPSVQRQGRWAFRSMLWIRKDIEAEQVPVQSTDLTAALLRLPDRSVLVVSVYVEGQNEEALVDTVSKLDQLTRETRNRVGTRVDVLLAGDFNRHDQLWGGDEVSADRQGEADPIIELMSEHGLCSLLPRGTRTWRNGGRESTIDLVLASEGLATSVVRCGIHATEHGSDHSAIETTFDVVTPEPVAEERLLFKNAPWKDIRARIEATLHATPVGGGVQQQTDRLMTAVLDAIHALTPKAKPSPYSKRWRTTDLTQLRRVYTYWRGQARSEHRLGRAAPELEREAKAASRQYYEAIRKQKKTHWDEFLADDANIWHAAKYLNSDGTTAFDKIPPLRRADETVTADKVEQAEELLATFFPPLPTAIEDEGPRPQRAPVAMPRLTMEEVERRVVEAQSWKAPGEDGLPAVARKEVWPAVKDRVLDLFQTSLDEGQLPSQWRNAKIIPRKKPGKEDYTIAKAWRPISLLSTLGKALESVVAERISYMAETFGLLPANHFGARKKRSTEQALMLLQESIYKAWRARKVLSLISFDVKGAYNGVYKDRLLQRLAARGIPAVLVRWIDAFCSDRTATILVNGHVSEQQQLPQAGLPQGSPLSPVLFLFFNADLVQRRIDGNGGSMAFVDDCTGWVVGPTAEANREGIQTIIDEALDWERRSGATFEGEKTILIHFTRNPNRTSTAPMTIKGEAVAPRESAKILGVVVDSKLWYKQHIARAATKGLAAAMAFKRLRMVSPSTARQLFGSTVAPVVDYASNIWMHACGSAAMASLNRVQRVGAQAITGAFRTVAVAVAETEASIRTVRERHADRATKLWVDLHTLPRTNPLSRISTTVCRRFTSPLQKTSQANEDVPAGGVEMIQGYTISPWEQRVPAIIDADCEKAVEAARHTSGIRVATSSSLRKDMVGMGGAIHDSYSRIPNGSPVTFAVTLGPRSEQNAYIAELKAIAMEVRGLPSYLMGREITIFTSNQAAIQVINKPRQQSGQDSIIQIYETFRKLKEGRNRVLLRWVPAQVEFQLGRDAKNAARRATSVGRFPQKQFDCAKSTIINKAKAERYKYRTLPEGVGQHLKKLDTAIPGRHTRKLYDAVGRVEACVLVQLRTGMARLNGYLHRIGAADTGWCTCGQARETVEHFLFNCSRWVSHRHLLSEQADIRRRGSLSYFLGGKAPSDPHNWRPNIKAVRTTVKYAISTGRLDREVEQASASQTTQQ